MITLLSTEQIYLIIIIVLASILGILALYPIVVYPFIARQIYSLHLERRTPELWGRVCSEPNDYEQRIMRDKGLEWAKRNAEFKEDLHIVSEGYNLYGEYYNYHKERTILIIAGRAESLCYGYYYAPIYEKLGYNILLVDKRAHGLSDGKYEDCGQKSYIDYINWAKFIHDNYGINHIGFHAICIGSSAALYACSDEKTPDYIEFEIADGMYKTFRESFKNHMKVAKRSTFIVLDEILLNAKIHSGVNLITDGPHYRIKKMHKPILFIYTNLDKFSTPKDGKALYERCPSKIKEIKFFDKGGHSHVRINNEEKYDAVVKEFLDKVYSK